MSMSDFEMKENIYFQTIMDAIELYILKMRRISYIRVFNNIPIISWFYVYVDDWWDPKQLVAMRFVSNLVLDLGWDNYGFMMRKIEYEIN